MNPSAVYVDTPPFMLEPLRTPFDEVKPGGDEIFVYMTNKAEHRWSRLLDGARLEELVRSLGLWFPVGYSQLWILKKERAFHRAGSKLLPEDPIPPDSRLTDATGGLDRLLWRGRMHVVLREPILRPGAGIHDDIALCADPGEAVRLGLDYAARRRRRAVMGLLVEDLQWH